MTWSEFKELVRVYLPVHGRRQGIQTLIDQYIKAAVLDLQEAVPALRENVTRTYPSNRFTADGFAAKGHYPVGVVLTHAFARNPEEPETRFEFRTAMSPGERYDMIHGMTRKGERWMAIDAPKGVFRVVPSPIEDGSEVVLSWSGITIDFEDSDDVLFGDREAEAAAEFVLSRITRMVDKDLPLSESHARSYKRLKRFQYVQHLESARLDGRGK